MMVIVKVRLKLNVVSYMQMMVKKKDDLTDDSDIPSRHSSVKTQEDIKPFINKLCSAKTAKNLVGKCMDQSNPDHCKTGRYHDGNCKGPSQVKCCIIHANDGKKKDDLTDDSDIPSRHSSVSFDDEGDSVPRRHSSASFGDEDVSIPRRHKSTQGKHGSTSFDDEGDSVPRRHSSASFGDEDVSIPRRHKSTQGKHGSTSFDDEGDSVPRRHSSASFGDEDVSIPRRHKSTQGKHDSASSDKEDMSISRRHKSNSDEVQEEGDDIPMRHTSSFLQLPNISLCTPKCLKPNAKTLWQCFANDYKFYQQKISIMFGLPNTKTAEANTQLLEAWKECDSHQMIEERVRVKCTPQKSDLLLDSGPQLPMVKADSNVGCECIDIRYSQCDLKTSVFVQNRCRGSNNIKGCQRIVSQTPP